MTSWRVALLYNLKHPSTVGADAAPDALAELAIPETVQSIELALQSSNYEIISLEADATILDTIRQTNPDICFNIARGIDGPNRLAHIPALLEMLNIPFTGSDTKVQALAVDKMATKLTWRAHGLPVASGQLVQSADDPLISEQSGFPLFVKPVREGSGTGIDASSIVTSSAELQTRVQWIIKTYQQPALVEPYLPGREFAVGLLGNNSSICRQYRHDLYDKNGFHLFPILEIDTSAGSAGGVYGAAARLRRPGDAGAPDYACPASLSHSLQAELQQLAVDAFNAVGAYDAARIDIRLDEYGAPHLLEIDTLPNLDPHLSDFCLMANTEGMAYKDLVTEILHLAMQRNCLLDVQLDLA